GHAAALGRPFTAPEPRREVAPDRRRSLVLRRGRAGEDRRRALRHGVAGSLRAIRERPPKVTRGRARLERPLHGPSFGEAPWLVPVPALRVVTPGARDHQS